jgi:hypothetical protein
VNVASDPARARSAKRRPPLRGAEGAESTPHAEPASDRETLVDEGIALFGSRYGRRVGREEARQMIERLTAFFRLLDEWEHREQGGPVEGEAAA